ncbi:MAG: ATP phosphoribosyltransferase regulatory subunit [Cellvibrionaceae bacterium]
MTNVDRWLLPDGVEEILPGQALQIERIRRELLDLYRLWGYEFVIPPLMEFTDSLLGLGQDLDLMTFKVTDQLSGRTLGIRADITPQTARMDAHSLYRQGANRLCYAGHVLFTKPKTPLTTRAPIMSGVELYGEAGLDADAEVLSLLFEALATLGLKETSVEIGHVGIFRALMNVVNLNLSQQAELFDLLQRKAQAETLVWVKENIKNDVLAKMICDLPRMAGDRTCLSDAKDKLKNISPEVVVAIEELEDLADIIQRRYPSSQLYFDLSEPHSFDYHTGIVFSVFAPGFGRSLASGGRYDHVGEVFGRARPATGFSLDVTAVNQLLNIPVNKKMGVFVLVNEDASQWEAIQALRAKGETVICGFSESEVVREEVLCDRQLSFANGKYVVEAWK